MTSARFWIILCRVMPAWNFVRHGFYRDSVALMALARGVEAVPGVHRAAVMMGTPENRRLLKDAGLLTSEGEAARPADLIIAVLADDHAAAEKARAAAEAALAADHSAAKSGSARPRTLDAALRALPGASIALISVPGRYAGAEAMKALRAGLHVMLFSDNVPIEAEIELKRLARERDLFLMGPDCGTAIINGVPLGFANAVPRGRIGIAAASGTGLQAVSAHIAEAGEGVSQAIGVGGRDLSDAVGGLMMEQALRALAADPSTEVVCVVAKPPGKSVLPRLETWLRTLGKPCVLQFTGLARTQTDHTHVTATLEDAAAAAVALVRRETPRAVEFTLAPSDVVRLVESNERALSRGQHVVRGVYCGGTLAYEALGILNEHLADVGATLTGGHDGHRVVDLGDDVFTIGRAHPMIDGTVRREWIAKEARDPATAVLLLDVVLGYGAHPDPAGELAPTIRDAIHAAQREGRHLVVVASVLGTRGDPQGLERQVKSLEAAGVIVLASNAQAARLAALIAARRAAA